jgi:hypothetical protein
LTSAALTDELLDTTLAVVTAPSRAPAGTEPANVD